MIYRLLANLIAKILQWMPKKSTEADWIVYVEHKQISLLDRLALGLSDFLHVVSEFGASGPQAYLDISGTNDEFTLTTKQNGLVGAIEICGRYQLSDQQDFVDCISTLERRWQTMMSSRGLTLDIVFTGGEKHLLRKQLIESVAPNIATSQRLGLGLERILESKVEELAERCAYEKTYLCIWLDQRCLSKSQHVATSAQVRAAIGHKFDGSGALDLTARAAALEAKHTTTVEQVLSDLNAVGLVATRVSCSQLLKELRLMIEPSNTAFDWMPALPGNHHLRTNLSLGNKDISHLFPPSLDQQLFPNGVGDLADSHKVISMGGKLHAGVIVTRPSFTPTNFDELFRTLKSAKIPYRIRISLHSDGLGSTALALKSKLSTLFAWTDAAGTSSKAIQRSLNFLRSLREQDSAVVGLSIVADTWVSAAPEGTQQMASLQCLETNVEKLTKAIQSWGSMDTKHISGDPLYTSMSAMPALVHVSPGEVAGAPLRDALVLLPLHRPAAYWATGGMLLRSPDGKVVPYEPVSSKQKAWGEIIVAPQRFGKSFWQQARNMALWTAKGITQLPYILTIDVGPSSAGFINLVKYSLPRDKQHLALYARLTNTKEFAVNPFDTQLGVRFPTPSKEGFLVNFLCLLLSTDDLTVQEGMPGLVLKALRDVYRRANDDVSPKRYQVNQVPEIDEWIQRTGFADNSNSPLTWWCVVDKLFSLKLYHLSSLAQRFAVPTLKDFAVTVANPEISAVFDRVRVSTSERATEYFIRRISEIVDAYPVLSSPTQFDVGEARVIALDLEKITGDDISSEGRRQTCAMYLLAREVLIGDLKVDTNDVMSFPPFTRSYHLKRVKELRETTKSLNYDEVHRISSQEQVIKQLSRDIREGPKYRVVTSLATQEIGDLDPSLINLAANKVLLGVGNPAEAKKIQSILGLSDAATQVLQDIRRAGPEGSTALYMLQIDESPGFILQPLKLTLGPEEVWAYSTTNEDDALRQCCYEKAGVTKTLLALKTYFPETTVTHYLEQLREANRGSESIDYIEEISQLILAGKFNRDGYLKRVKYGNAQ